MADYSRAIELDPTASLALNNRGKLYAGLGKLAEANTDLTRAIVLNPDDASAYYKRALALFQAGDLVHARQDAERASRLGRIIRPAFMRAFQESTLQ